MADEKVFDIFGSDIEDEEPRKRGAKDDKEGRVSRRRRDDSPPRSAARITDDLDDDEYEEEDANSGAKKRRKSGGSSGKRKIRRRDEDEDVEPRRRRDDDDFIDDTEDRRAASDEDDVVRTEGGLEIGKSIEDDEEQPKKKKLSAFDEALEKTKSARRSRGKELDRNRVESECITFLDRMMQARDSDMECYKNGRPALNKLKMLREVEQMITKVTHRETLVENMLLPIIKAWLDPMQDGTLPNVQIRTSILKILGTFRVDDEWVEKLRNSQGLGRVIHYYAKNEEHPPNKRMAEKLMMSWARPVYNASVCFHDMYNEYDRPADGHRAPEDAITVERRAAREATKHYKTTRERLDQMRTKDEKAPEPIMAPIPKPKSFLFTALASGTVTADPKTVKEHRQQASTSRKVNRTMNRMRLLNKNRNARAVKPSVNGRD